MDNPISVHTKGCARIVEMCITCCYFFQLPFQYLREAGNSIKFLSEANLIIDFPNQGLDNPKPGAPDGAG